jgi:hypothetical protein
MVIDLSFLLSVDGTICFQDRKKTGRNMETYFDRFCESMLAPQAPENGFIPTGLQVQFVHPLCRIDNRLAAYIEFWVLDTGA